MISLGLRLRDLGSDELTWHDLWVIIKHGPRDSAFMRERYPEIALWGLPEQLLAEIVDVQHWLRWAKTKDATSKPPKNMPEPIPRPGVTPPKREIYKFDVMSQDEALAWLGWEQPLGVD